MAKIMLAGFDAQTAKKLSLTLEKLNHQIESVTYDLVSSGVKQADLVFVSGDDARFQRGLSSLITKARSSPVIVASRTVNDALWISALEAGASDYCSVDVDPANLAWMIDNLLQRKTLEHKAFAGAA